MQKTRGVEVNTLAGRLVGQVCNDVFVFKGIPYGEPTGSPRRFRPPAIKSPWTGIRRATALGRPCVQSNDDYPAWCDIMPSSEDCLVANVWTPTLESRAKLPVMVWLHGGGFANGSAGLPIYDGQRLSHAETVVVVSINHRLNMFGFLYLGGLSSEYEDSANLGLQDIVLGLEWVQANICLFGGDPANVTLFGESGGGAKISALMSMPSARGLYSRVIIQSGWLLNMLSRDEATQRANIVRRALNLNVKHVDRMRLLPVSVLKEVGASLFAGAGYGMFFPVVDGRIIPSNPWLDVDDYAGSAVPMLVGTTADEGAYCIPDSLHSKSIASDKELVQSVVRLTSLLSFTQAEARRLIDSYRELRTQVVSRHRCLMDILTSVLFSGNAVHQAGRHAAHAPVFMYRFDWTYPCWGDMYSPHAAEVPFVFGTLDYKEAAFGASDSMRARHAADPTGMRFVLSRNVQRSWAAFARRGDPSHAEVPRWTRYSHARRSAMILDWQCQTKTDAYESASHIVRDWNLPNRRIGLASPMRARTVRGR